MEQQVTVAVAVAAFIFMPENESDKVLVEGEMGKKNYAFSKCSGSV